jgi:predicted dehydrogenase
MRGVVARGSKRSFDLAGALGVPLFDQLAEAIQETSPNLAVVAVSDRANPALAIELLQSGAHVLCAHPVAPTAEDVLTVARVARQRNLLVSTDYSLRTTEAFRLGQLAVAELGRLLRIEITYPGRFLPIVLDLALTLGGQVDAVSAFGRYPEELRARREAAPAAFPPTTILEHVQGAVTALTPSPHAAPAAAVRITTSSTGGRVEIALPAGGARRLRCRPGGLAEEVEIAPAYAVTDPGAAFADAMYALANAFVDAIVKGQGPPCPLESEANLRRVWAAIPRAARARTPVMVDEGTSTS